MVLAYILAGVAAGLLGLLIALGSGVSIWSAVLVYSVVGAVTVLFFPMVLLAIGKFGDQRWPGNESAPDSVAPDDTVFDSSKTAAVKSAERNEQGLRILAADDDALIRDMLVKIAAEVECPDITLASSGAQAIEIIETSAKGFDCLLLDINMPEMDGIDLCRHVRNMPAYEDTPIIMLTAMSDMDHIERAFRAGATDYTTKPFDIIALGARLQDAKAQIAARRLKITDEEHVADFGGNQDRITTWLSQHVEALIKRDALQNYMARMSGSTLSEAYVMAILVERGFGHPIAATSDTTPQGLMAVARAIDEVFDASGYLMAYMGAGEFVLVASAATFPNAEAIETEIQDRLNQVRLDAENWADKFARVSVGQAVRPGRRSDDRARIAFESAAILVHSHSAAKRRAFQSGNVRPLKL